MDTGVRIVSKMVRLRLKTVLDEKNISRYELAKRSKIAYQTVDRYYKNWVVRYDGYILARFCEVLGCGVGDLLECVDAPEGEEPRETGDGD